MLGVSVVICCYNSVRRLEKTLYYLSLQVVDMLDCSWEIILVDNNSTDGTANTANEIWQEFNVNVPFKIVQEKQPGLSFARDKGQQTATYKIIVFCDDDNWLSPGYLKHAYSIMADKPNVGMLVGHSTAVFEEDKEPFWFKKFEAAYAVGKIKTETGLANDIKHLSGAGVVMRKEIYAFLLQNNFKAILSGRKGKSLLSGEDSELSLITYYLGYDLYYSENLHFYHFMTLDRLDWQYCVKLISNGIAPSRIALFFYNYCFHEVEANRVPNFGYAYKKAIKKALKQFLKEIKSLADLFFLLKIIFISYQGSQKEIKLKSVYQKIRFTISCKSQLRMDFIKIEAIIKAINAKKKIRPLINE